MPNELQRSDKGFAGVLRLLGMSNTDRVNQINRSVNEYHPCLVDAFFEPSKGVYNSIVSGGDNRIRTNAMVAQAVCAIHNNFPVIVLHEGNRELENQMKSNFSSTGQYIEISARSPCFEPFYGLNELEISNQIIETEYRHNPLMMQRMMTLQELEPYRHMSRNEVVELADKGIIDRTDMLVKLNFASLVRRFERENINVTEFGADIPFDRKIEIITNTIRNYVSEDAGRNA